MNQILKQPQKIRVDENDLEDVRQSDGGYNFYNYEGKPFTGYMVMDYHSNGYVMYEEEYKEGEHTGRDNLYYENGLLERETLMVGATSLDYIEYDEEGNITSPSRPFVSEEELLRLTKKYNLD